MGGLSGMGGVIVHVIELLIASNDSEVLLCACV